MRSLSALAAILLPLLLPVLLGGCSVGFGGPPLVSGASISDAQAQGAEPQPLNSLPPGATGLPSGPNAAAPNYAAVRIGAGAGRSTY